MVLPDSAPGPGRDDLPRELIGGRYEVEQRLGRGGNAEVFRVRDTVDGRSLALKRLTATGRPTTVERIVQLFEQEYLTLAQLSHPRIVSVHDYFTDVGVPCYTMELLDGGDLRRLAPLLPGRVCEVLADACSALSLLHSRRLVHRDLTPTNVRCTADGKGKLIDLGAMARAGACKHVVGTPAFIAPEAINAQFVDARSDLFALGATAYYALTGRHAYPAREISQLKTVWRSPPAPPSEYVDGIPGALDELVLQLLQIDAFARPGSAAEVMDRLSAIGGFSVDEQLRVQQAYLAMPTLVGRDASLQRVRKQIGGAVNGDGRARLITGLAGVGRSRFLDATVLEAKLLGAIVLRADARDAGSGEWGGARALLRQLFEVAPEIARRCGRTCLPELNHVDPELAGLVAAGPGAESAIPSLSFEGPQQLRARLTEAIGNLLLDACEHRGLMLAVDDVDLLDEASAVLVAWLSSKARGRRLMVMATATLKGEAVAGAAASWLKDNGSATRLRELDAVETEQLLSSVFGDVPNVRVLADRLFSISSGNPKAIMQLAEHLLERGAIRFQAGSFLLPGVLNAADLPRSLGEALDARFARLGPLSLALARFMALSSRPGLSLRECVRLVDGATLGELAAALDELIVAEVFVREEQLYSLAHPSLRSRLLRGLPEREARALHARLADLLSEADDRGFRRVQHLLGAGAVELAVDELVEVMGETLNNMAQSPAAFYDYALSLPADWSDTFEHVIAYCDQAGTAARKRFELQAAFVTFSGVKARTPRGEFMAVVTQLRHDAGVDLYEALPPDVPAGERLARAFTEAQARFDATPEHERVLPPALAIQRLARFTVLAIAMAGRALDRGLLEAMPSLEPFRPFSPALVAIEENRKATLNVLAGRLGAARQGYRAILAQLGDDPPPGMERTTHQAMRDSIRWAVGFLEISSGVDDDSWAEAIESSPLFEVNAWRLRAMRAFLQGDAKRGEELKRQLELLRMRNRPPQLFEGTSLWAEVVCHAVCDDLVRVKHVIPRIREMAEEHPGWVPCLHYAVAQYERLRGDRNRALAELDRGIALVQAGRHVAWARLAAARVRVLAELGRAPEALEYARAAHAEAKREELSGLYFYTQQALAVAHAASGDLDRAAEYSDEAIEEHRAFGAAGAVLGDAFEVRARIAVLAGDHAGFRRYAAVCAEHLCAGEDPVLTAKYERLLRFAQRRGLGKRPDLHAPHAPPGETGKHEQTALSEMLSTCAGPADRAARALAMLVKATGCSGGCLYLMQPGGPVLSARQGASSPPAHMDTVVMEYVSRALRDDSELETAIADPGVTLDAAAPTRASDSLPVLLYHDAPTGLLVTGLVLLDIADVDAFRPAPALVRAISRSLHDAGDASGRG